MQNIRVSFCSLLNIWRFVTTKPASRPNMLGAVHARTFRERRTACRLDTPYVREVSLVLHEAIDETLWLPACFAYSHEY